MKALTNIRLISAFSISLLDYNNHFKPSPLKIIMILGVTGKYAAGKDTVAELLQKMNFFHVSFSDLLREELQRRKEQITRNNLIHVGNELREKFGADILARRALTKVKDGENYVFTSIRNPSEVE